MHPDAYIPLYYRVFFEAVQPHPNDVCVAYLRAICYYVGHLHCKGIPNDDKQLRKICGPLDTMEWEDLRDVIFDNDHFFSMDNKGLWHQKRAEEEYEKAKENYHAAVERGKRGGWWKQKRNLKKHSSTTS